MKYHKIVWYSNISKMYNESRILKEMWDFLHSFFLFFAFHLFLFIFRFIGKEKKELSLKNREGSFLDG